MGTAASAARPVDRVLGDLLAFYEQRGNTWFVDEFWAENHERLRMMARDALALCPPDGERQALDVGCFNGFASFIFAGLGYAVTSSDQIDFPERQELLAGHDARFVKANFNEPGAYGDLPEGVFDLVWMGEVIEHVLMHPLGIMRNIRRVMRPDGLLILTTPNAATAMNMYRLSRGQGFVRGTELFVNEPKLGPDGQVISHPEIHYREYVPAELDALLEQAGFRVRERRFLPVGSSVAQSWLKRVVKENPLTRQLLSTRLFGATQYCLATPR